MKLISVVSPCCNEEGNVQILYERVKAIFDQLPQYHFEMIMIDNASTDHTLDRLKEIAASDKRFKVIANLRNFGHVRSPFYALLQARGDAVISMASDLQDPPELIMDMIKAWEEGELLVAAVKHASEENPIVYKMRTTYYRLLNSLGNVDLIEHFTGFGLYDRRVIEELRHINDPYPYVRGLVSELGFKAKQLPFEQPTRKHGKTKLNLYHLLDFAMLGLTSHSIVPMRLATITGLCLSVASLLVALFYLIYKIIFWQRWELGMAPVVIGMFAMFSIQLFFIGLLGEYIGASHRQLLHRPLVVEKERINFEYKETD